MARSLYGADQRPPDSCRNRRAISPARVGDSLGGGLLAEE